MVIFITKSGIPEGKVQEVIKSLSGFLPHIGDSIAYVGEFSDYIMFRTPAPLATLDRTTRRYFKLLAEGHGIREGSMFFFEAAII